jgi:signal transduction histidine kinase
MLDAVTEFLTRGAVDDAQQVLEKALVLTRGTIGELRDLSFNLEPVVLRDHGFTTAVNALAQDRGIELGIKIDLDVAVAESLPERTQAALYQIVREALEGAIRRGPPQNFSVTLHPDDPQTLALTIRDDAPGERRRRSIEVLEERARTLHAAVSLQHDDTGSTLRLVLPIYAVSE